MYKTSSKRFIICGVLCVEFFVTANGIFANEIAPRPHNSGHLTIEACECSQFEQQVRALCGLPLGSTRFCDEATMVNLLGDHWIERSPQFSEVLQEKSAFLHIYGKDSPKMGRKMGHITVLHENSQERALSLRASL